jgi:hypothetical protein
VADETTPGKDRRLRSPETRGTSDLIEKEELSRKSNKIPGEIVKRIHGGSFYGISGRGHSHVAKPSGVPADSARVKRQDS